MERRDSSYTGIVIDPDNNVLTLYVHGSPNAASLKVLGAEKVRGYRLVVSQAPYSRAALDAAQDKLWQSRDTFNIESVVGEEEGTRVVVGIRAADPAARLQSTGQSAKIASQSAKTTSQSPAPPTDQELTAFAGVPVITEPSEVAPARGTRGDDADPFNGGAWIVNTSTNPKGNCTSGFGVAIGRTTYMATAGHCGSNGDDFMSSSWQYLGKMTWNGLKQRKMVDAALIKAHVEGYVYDGAYDDGTGFRKPVAGYSRTAKGMKVCVSGSESGVACNIKVTRLGQRMFSDDGYEVRSDAAEQLDGLAAGGEGDSGAPVFTVTPRDNFSRVTIVGIFSAIDLERTVQCQGLQEDRKCSRKIWFARFDNLRINAGITRILTAAA